jgi:hypothetical protein
MERANAEFFGVALASEPGGLALDGRAAADAHDRSEST